VVAGCVIFGLSMAGWMLPVGLLRTATPATHVAWRTALFRVVVDGGMFLGPFASGLLGAPHARVLPVMLAAALLTVGIALLTRAALATMRERRARALTSARSRRARPSFRWSTARGRCRGFGGSRRWCRSCSRRARPAGRWAR